MRRKAPTKKRSAGFKPAVSHRFTEALGYAARLDIRQTRKGKDQPYVGHLLAVASIVIQHSGGEEEAIAALLHDAVEDQGGLSRGNEIRRKFGARVARIVDGCTDAYTDSKPPWKERKLAYVPESSPRAERSRRGISQGWLKSVD